MIEGIVEGGVAALIPAAGLGHRLGLGHKAFLRLGGRTLLCRAVEQVRSCTRRIVVGVPPTHLETARAEVGRWATVVTGGQTRVGTLSAMLVACDEPLVVIVDAAAPFASTDLIRAVIQAAARHGASAAGDPPSVPVVRVEDGLAVSSIPRPHARLVHTPNAFRRPVLERILHLSRDEPNDDLGINDLCVRLGQPVSLVPDEPMNIKVTTPFDWQIAQHVIGPVLDGVRPV